MRSQRNRQELIDAARRVFAEQGISAEVKEIAAQAGVGIGTFYRNFPHKQHLVIALLDEADEITETAFAEAERGERSGLERLHLILTQFFELERRYGWLIEAMWTGQLPKEWPARTYDEQKGERFQAFLQQGIEEGTLRPDINPNLVFGMLLGPVVFGRRLSLNLEPAEAAAGLLQLLLQGAGRENSDKDIGAGA